MQNDNNQNTAVDPVNSAGQQADSPAVPVSDMPGSAINQQVDNQPVTADPVGGVATTPNTQSVPSDQPVMSDASMAPADVSQTMPAAPTPGVVSTPDVTAQPQAGVPAQDDNNQTG